MNKWFFLLSLVPFIFGCQEDSSGGLSSANDEMISLVKDQKRIWEESGIKNYMFTYSSSPSDCPTVEPAFPVVITVEDGEVSSVYSTGSGTFSDNTGNSPTIDMTFESMVERLKEDPIVFSRSPTERELEPEFDDRYGFPTRYYYDQSSEECDAVSVSIREFQ